MQEQDRGPLGSLLYLAAFAVFEVIIGGVTERGHPTSGWEGTTKVVCSGMRVCSWKYEFCCCCFAQGAGFNRDSLVAGGAGLIVQLDKRHTPGLKPTLW